MIREAVYTELDIALWPETKPARRRGTADAASKNRYRLEIFCN
jgi:hypothetical protein